MSTTEASAVTGPSVNVSRYPWMLIGLLWVVAFLTIEGR